MIPNKEQARENPMLVRYLSVSEKFNIKNTN
jgi:hypothetical protein